MLSHQFRSGRAALIALTAIASAALTLTPAQAQTAGSPAPTALATPDYTCSQRTICVWPNDNFTGQEYTFLTSEWHSAWHNWADVQIPYHPGSLDDDSNSIIWVYDKDSNNAYCLNPDSWVLYNDYGYFYIAYNVGSCNGASVPLPLP